MLQALEVLKIILNMPDVISGRLLVFDGVETKFHNLRLRPKNANCVICGDNPTIDTLIDYEEFCGAKANDKEPNLNLLEKDDRITVEDYNRNVQNSKPHLLIDVRSPEEYEICHLQNSINIPLTELSKDNSLELIKNNVREKKLQDGECAVDCKIHKTFLKICFELFLLG